MNKHTVPNATIPLPGKPDGASGARFYDFDDGMHRLVKWFPSTHGPRMVYNELVASRLGQLIEAPILRGSVVYMPDDVIPSDHKPQAKSGFQFGVYRMEGDDFQPTEHYLEIENKSELNRAAVLLAWLQVDDHEHKNQYLQRLEVKRFGQKGRKQKLFRLIDMGWAFGNCYWNADDVGEIPKSYSLPAHMIDNLHWSDIEPVIDEVKAIPESTIRECLADVPDDWQVSAQDVDAATSRILKSRAALADMIKAGNPTMSGVAA